MLVWPSFLLIYTTEIALVNYDTAHFNSGMANRNKPKQHKPHKYLNID